MKNKRVVVLSVSSVALTVQQQIFVSGLKGEDGVLGLSQGTHTLLYPLGIQTGKEKKILLPCREVLSRLIECTLLRRQHLWGRA